MIIKQLILSYAFQYTARGPHATCRETSQEDTGISGRARYHARGPHDTPPHMRCRISAPDRASMQAPVRLSRGRGEGKERRCEEAMRGGGCGARQRGRRGERRRGGEAWRCGVGAAWWRGGVARRRGEASRHGEQVRARGEAVRRGGEARRRGEARGGVALWRCGVVALWRCGVVTAWRCGVVAAWRVWRGGEVRRGLQVRARRRKRSW